MEWSNVMLIFRVQRLTGFSELCFEGIGGSYVQSHSKALYNYSVFKKKTQHHTALFAMSQSLLAHVFPFVLMFSSDLGVSSVQRPLLVKCILLVEFYS